MILVDIERRRVINPPPRLRKDLGKPVDEVRRLHAEGHSLRGIATSLGLHYRTVERYVRSDACPEWCPGRRRPSRLDQFAGVIGQRLGDG